MSLNLAHLLLKIIIIAVVGIYGIYNNGVWKYTNPAPKDFKTKILQLISGLMGWAGILLLFFGYDSVKNAIILLVLSVGCSYLPFLFNKGYLGVNIIHSFTAGLGKWFGLFMKLTIIGYAVVQRVELVAKDGSAADVNEMMEIVNQSEDKYSMESMQKLIDYALDDETKESKPEKYLGD